MFLLYINDLPSAIEDASVILFADDASVCLGDCSLDNLIHKTNSTLACLSEWTFANKISINATKTEALIITNRPVDLSNVNINLWGELLRVADEVTYLAFKIDKNLIFDAHAKKVYSKVAKTFGILFKLRSYLNTDSMISLYYSLVYPYFTYGNIVWTSTYPRHLECLVQIQKRIIRVITNSYPLAHTSALFKNLKFFEIL